MSQQFFDVREHVFNGQHIREYPQATAHNQEEVLQLVAKQYIPKSNRQPQPGDVTIIGAHANGFPKELYEALWDDLLAETEKHGFRIRSIWIADVAWEGQSSHRNEAILGNDPSWYDHARDLLQMVNTFRAEMPRPLVGIGHSFGGTIVTYLSLMHPRLLSSLVLLDPVLHFYPTTPVSGFNPLALSAVRRDQWPSREAAAAAFRQSKFYAAWDQRVLDAWLAYGLRELPTTPATGEARPVTLATTKHQEVFTFLRPLMQGIDGTTGRRVFRRDRLPDVSDKSLERLGATNRLFRPEVPNTTEQLGHLRPGVCYVFGGISPMSTPDVRREKMELTGVQVGGSGGVAAGRVRQVVLPTTGHLVAMEQPTACARAAAETIAAELVLWREEEADLALWWRRKDADKQVLDDEWRSFIEPIPTRDKGKL
ncbi:toxin biosynthesis protein [Grosmannia clavigera kw1407]|uniref:Toxin biosynthesis protein n=1 Tax=Grosmannia clavigera (strain kw1407 / UAMH 11150) TaxID=655863 RepID=F0XFY2_GROCL|nr:toxin biosynthesis protein [Grosmannia clavigera kw1407]EFX03400.1 toxin biosynthesis protein [Grosmannia clavigera kw1407]